MTILSSKYFKYIYYNALQFSQKKGDLFLRSPKSGGEEVHIVQIMLHRFKKR